MLPFRITHVNLLKSCRKLIYTIKYADSFQPDSAVYCMQKRLPFICLILILVFLPSVAFAIGLPLSRAKKDVFPENGICSAADAARIARAAEAGSAGGNALDLTQNGILDATDVRVALWSASGLIPDLVDFVEHLSEGLCPEEEFHRFSYNGVHSDGNGNYRSQNVSISISSGKISGSTYYLADIFLQDIHCLRTAFSGARYRSSSRSPKLIASDNHAILSINGDFYSVQKQGPIIRNGVTYYDYISRVYDTAVLTETGELLTFSRREINSTFLSEFPVWQTWVFGPRLLDASGNSKKAFNSEVTAANPRTVIGYYAPGHYCFLVVDGRQYRYSDGMTMMQLSAFCASLGMKTAYNLDGGQSSQMLSQNGFINHPINGGRPVSDIVYICDPEVIE